MVTVGLFVRMEAKAGREDEVERFLKDALPLVHEEPATKVWFAVRLGPLIYAIFDAFPDESGRAAHLAGKVAEALHARAGELFATPPHIERMDVLAVKLDARAPLTSAA
jgi:quinol monooxygenase YgiN